MGIISLIENLPFSVLPELTGYLSDSVCVCVDECVDVSNGWPNSWPVGYQAIDPVSVEQTVNESI